MSAELTWLAADGFKIGIGSVLRRVGEPETRGVVVNTIHAGQNVSAVLMPVEGDVHIQLSGTGGSVTRVTNKHLEWEHIPRAEQTYTERYLSWVVSPWQDQEDRGADGILALLPDVAEQWDYQTLEDALRTIAQHMDELAAVQKDLTT